jgi:hypothetical protein
MAIVKDVKPTKAAPAKPIKPIAAPVIARPNIVQGKPAPRQQSYIPGFTASEPKIPALYGNNPFPPPFAPRSIASLQGAPPAPTFAPPPSRTDQLQSFIRGINPVPGLVNRGTQGLRNLRNTMGGWNVGGGTGPTIDSILAGIAAGKGKVW